jgi:peptide/nickel transport system substrate-binding protein
VGVAGYDPATPVRPFDPEGARRLLAEAGFPQGFRLTLHTPNDRFPNDSRLAQALAQMWTRVGVRTEVEALPWASFSARSARQEFAMTLTSWGSTSGEGLSFPVNILQTHNPAARTGPGNARRFSSAELDTMIDEAAAIMDDAARDQAIHRLVRWVAEQAPAFPLLHLQNLWAHRRGLAHDPRMDERTLAMGVRPAAQ